MSDRKIIEPRTLPGFRDFLPKEAKKRQYVINTLKGVFESFGFEPLETPTLEYEDILLGKYGDEGNRLMYRFKDNGQRPVAMRYDQTVPLARVMAQYANLLPTPFKRYQIQPVWRADKPQQGRFREFLQCDIDTIGSSSLFADAEIIFCIISAVRKLGFKDAKMLINDRSVFKDLQKGFVTIVDKIDKIGRDKVIAELVSSGLDRKTAENVLSNEPTPYLISLFQQLNNLGLKEGTDYEFSGTLARGLDYYTSTIFELRIASYGNLSVGGGGRYDKLINMFSASDTDIPAVGFAFGFDRVMEALEQLNLLPKETRSSVTKVLVTIFNQELLPNSLGILQRLRENGINSEIYLEPSSKLDRQLKYADVKGIPYAVIIGPDEAEKNLVTVKNLPAKEQRTIPEADLLNEIK